MNVSQTIPSCPHKPPGVELLNRPINRMHLHMRCRTNYDCVDSQPWFTLNETEHAKSWRPQGTINLTDYPGTSHHALQTDHT